MARPRRAKRSLPHVPRRVWYLPAAVLIAVVTYGLGYWAIPVWEEWLGNLGWAFVGAFLIAFPIAAGLVIGTIRLVEGEL